MLRKLARWWINRYPEGSITRIRSGPAKGMLWKRSHAYVNGYWCGTYEVPCQRALVRLLAPGMSVFDLGANAGFFSLLALSQVGVQGRCLSVDPSPNNCELMRAHCRANGLKNWQIEQAAVSDCSGKATFEFCSAEDAGGHLGNLQRFEGDNPQAAGSAEVRCYTVDELVASFFAPGLIKMDIEGAEYEAFKGGGADRTLTSIRPTFFLELHGKERASFVAEKLQRHGYRLTTLDDTPCDFSQPAIYHVIARPG
jgi:FkbM family methyltransferase